MRWVGNDIERFLEGREYIDTAIIPLQLISFQEDIKQTAAMNEFIQLLTLQLEKQFKGRLMLLPGYTYMKNDAEDKRVDDVKHWKQTIKEQEFKHVFFITSDSDWKLREELFEGGLIWLPTLPLEHIEEKHVNAILEEQVKQLNHILLKKWQLEK